MSNRKFYEPYSRYCSRLQEQGQLRTLLATPTPTDELIDFSGNDYLNLNGNTEIMTAANKAMQRFGTGSTGSRLLSGNYELFVQTEALIAQCKGEESALILNSGYQANVSILAALLERQTLGQQALVFCDKGAHASIYQGIQLSGAQLLRYRHNDMQHLSELLDEYNDEVRPKFIITETVHGMDGDIADLPALAALAHKNSAFLYLDEAHATGIFGMGGYGLSTTINLANIPHLVMGTFSKALGLFGAYVAGSAELCQYLLNRCAGFIYSTALPPMVVGAILKAWELVGGMEYERARLLQLAQHLRGELVASGFDVGASNTHIIPIILSSEAAVMQAKDQLWQTGILVSAIRPPTVPPASSRLRIALTLKHGEHEVERLLVGLRAIQ